MYIKIKQNTRARAHTYRHTHPTHSYTHTPRKRWVVKRSPAYRNGTVASPLFRRRIVTIRWHATDCDRCEGVGRNRWVTTLAPIGCRSGPHLRDDSYGRSGLTVASQGGEARYLSTRRARRKMDGQRSTSLSFIGRWRTESSLTTTDFDSSDLIAIQMLISIAAGWRLWYTLSRS